MVPPGDFRVGPAFSSRVSGCPGPHTSNIDIRELGTRARNHFPKSSSALWIQVVLSCANDCPKSCHSPANSSLFSVSEDLRCRVRVAVGVLISSLTSCKGSGCSPRTIIYNDESTVLLPTSYSFAMSLFPWFEVKICFISERHCKLQLYFVTFCISESFPIDSVRPFVMDIKCHWWQQFKVCKDSESNLKSQYIYWKLSVFVKKIKKHFKRLH